MLMSLFAFLPLFCFLSHVDPENVQIGWPTSLPTSEKDAFVKSVLQEKVTFYCSILLRSILVASCHVVVPMEYLVRATLS